MGYLDPVPEPFVPKARPRKIWKEENQTELNKLGERCFRHGEDKCDCEL